MAKDLRLEPRIADLGAAVLWLDGRLNTRQIADVFGIKEAYVRQLRFRANWQPAQLQVAPELLQLLAPPIDLQTVVPDRLRKYLGVRPRDDSITVCLNGREEKQLDKIDEQIKQMGFSFWSGVRFGAGIGPLRSLRAHIGNPAHPRRIRALARLRQLIAENYVHTGHSLSAIKEGLASFHLSRVAYNETGTAEDLAALAKTALLISQSHLLRRDRERARVFLDLTQQAHEKISTPPGGEYHRQRGVVAFQADDDNAARRWFVTAARVFSETVEYGRTKQLYEILNIGQRQMNLLGAVNWDDSQRLLQYMLKATLPGDIHVSMNINWTAACGLAIDSPAANSRALELLEQSKAASVGFGHQATVSWLLSLTPKIPARHRAEWVRFALYFNAFQNQ